ncbi:MAG: ammonium transporter [Salana multivorans]|uniref:ammonium transporter n=1 Tax=Salana multivorans TaxID=120377 RepID=UPI000966C6DC|nr:ammonium transporter [Salana multivorans]MBN8881757.1 ammonium transporter [Salana multivorans]OJX95682.1 MAG: ammonium transporter [Micrococcales bacterium 73-15]
MEWDSGNAAWMLTASSLVLLMTPGLALFYGGMSRAKSVLNMMMMSFGVMGIVGVIYILWGWSMSYGTQSVGGIFNNPFESFGLSGVIYDAGGEWIEGLGAYPQIIDIAFQVTFAIITTALISGALAERVKFSAWMIFAGIWVTLAYFPMAHMVWGGGLLSGAEGSIAAALFGVDADGVANTAPIDFAGGTVVHINAGIAALVLALVIGKRRGFGRVPMKPHNLTLTMLGAGLLWFGWFGFNAGSAFAADGLAGWAWVNTTAATAAAILGWLAVERIRDGHATSLGAASGVVAGLVAITPAAGALNPVGSLVLGAIAGVACAYAVGLKYRLGFDDSLDVVGVHLVGGLVGTVLIGFLAVDGSVFFSDGHLGFGGFEQLAIQVIIALVALVFSGVITWLIAIAIKATVGWRITEESEISGIDLTEHGESAYEGIAAGRFATEGK